MLNTRVLSLLELPSEIICQIPPLLSSHDLSVCVRVNKAWHQAFMDSLWHTVKLRDVSRHSVERPVFDRINALYGQHLESHNDKSGSEDTVATRSPFLQNLHRIRVIKVQYTNFLNLFWEHGQLPLEPIPLEQLSIDFEDDPGRTTSRRRTYGFPGLLDMEPILQILGRSSRLSTFTFVTAIANQGTLRTLHPQDQARLLANFPPSLKRLEMVTDRRFHGHVTSSTEQEEENEALELFLELDKRGCFENLAVLSILGVPMSMKLVVALLERSPKLEELSLNAYRATWSDRELFELISKVSSRGWKTLGFRSMSGKVGPLSMAAILRHSATLENIRLTNCLAFDSKSIQKLLCSAPNLRRFDTTPSYLHGELEPLSLLATDIVESTEDWACLGLETFKCYISGVPRPDITSKGNGRPLTGEYNAGCRSSMLESSRIQRGVLAQLGRLTKLRDVTLGKDVIEYRSKTGEARRIEKRLEGAHYSPHNYELGSQYQCLTMSLQDGLDELKNLKCLRRLTLEKMSLHMGEAEQTWMKENWPEYGKKSRDSFWKSRDHYVPIGTDLLKEKMGDDATARAAIKAFDWW
ncbi:hypothetical protein EMPS_05017 [Entomortierella parvispora]|uniref:F-box domain-containing protein n=1 Tax=Entomortierella parvispora TaxID=205924 RepID=A0A9P3H9I5_9FUNG|nr:hypothetical protein EMPS_05017 [Entomortierella parvispora]